MYESSATRIAKRYNRRKSSRDPPLAVMGNLTSPSHSFSIDERTFRRDIFPLAVANKWFEVTAPTANIIETVSQLVEDSDGDLLITAPNVFSLIINVRDDFLSGGSVRISFYSGDDLIVSYPFGPETGQGSFYTVILLPGTLLIYGSGTFSTDIKPVNSLPITKINLVNASYTGNAILYSLDMQSGQPKTRNASLWKPLH